MEIVKRGILVVDISGTKLEYFLTCTLLSTDVFPNGIWLIKLKFLSVVLEQLLLNC